MSLQLDTKTKILNTTGQLFSQKGYFGVSMQDIANELNITKAALYYHFKSKDELTEILLQKAVDQLKIQIKHDIKTSKQPLDILFNIIKTFLDFKINHPEISLLTTLGSGRDEQIPILAVVAKLRHELIKFIRDLVGGIDFTRKLTYRTIVTITTSIISFTLSPFYVQKDQSTKQMAEDLSKLLTSQNIK